MITPTSFTAMLFCLLVGHAVADYWGQSDFMARAKNPNFDYKFGCPPGQKPQMFWPYVLTSHALIHGGAVMIATGSVLLGVAETIGHFVIDYGKCKNYYGIHVDQWMHIFQKVCWAYLALRGVR